MKFIAIYFCLLLPLSAAEFNGYIVKFKKAPQFQLSLDTPYKVLKVQKGEFLWFKEKTPILANLENIIEYIEPNFIYRIEEENQKGLDISPKAEEDLFGSQWPLENTGKNFIRTVFHGGVKGKDIKAKDAWEITTGSREVVVGIMDSGVDYEHPELRQNLWVNEAERDGEPGIDDDNNGYVDDIHGYGFGKDSRGGNTPMDFSGHGTHIAGTIAATDRDLGVRGVAPNVRIMLLKTRSDGGNYEVADIIEAIDYGLKMGATLITSSIGGNPFSQAYLDQLNKLDENKMLFVQAAGNHSKNLNTSKIYPPSYNLRNMVVVGNHSGNGKRWMNSNIGDKVVDIFAPGMNILSTAQKTLYNGTTRRGGHGYRYLSGTSMAAPHVAGALALLYSIEPNIGHLEAKERLLATVAKEKSMRKQCVSSGRLDVNRLLRDIRD